MQISIWERETFLAPRDVIIAGSGFTGLWTAFYLKRKAPELRITVLERGQLPAGASTRNAGFACFGSLSELVHDGIVMGADNMLELVALRHKGLAQIQKHFKKEEIDFELCGGYELYPPGTHLSVLQDNMQYINSLLQGITGSRRTFQLDDDNIQQFGFAGTAHLIKNKHEGALHSGKLLQGLLQMVQKMGVQVINGVEINGFEKQHAGFEIHTTGGLIFTANRIAVCTNAFAKSLLPDVAIIPARGQVLVTSPIKDLRLWGTFHADEGFYYFRNLGDRVLLGGARNKAFEAEATEAFGTTPLIQEELEKYLAEVILPHHAGDYTIEHRWSGIMGMGPEKRPIVGEVQPDVFAAVRMSGMGVALAPVAAKRLSKMMLA